MNAHLEFIKLIVSRLDRAGIPYMLTGSMAMAIYSLPRMTRDIDLVVQVETGDAQTLLSLFTTDCYIDKDAVHDAILDHGMFNIIHNTWVIKADFIIRKNDEYRVEEFGRRRKILVEGFSLFIVAPEDLILSKLIWHKSSDSELQLRDVKQMIKSFETLDWKYLEKWAGHAGIENILQKVKMNHE